MFQKLKRSLYLVQQEQDILFARFGIALARSWRTSKQGLEQSLRSLLSSGLRR